MVNVKKNFFHSLIVLISNTAVYLSVNIECDVESFFKLFLHKPIIIHYKNIVTTVKQWTENKSEFTHNLFKQKIFFQITLKRNYFSLLSYLNVLKVFVEVNIWFITKLQKDSSVTFFFKLYFK